jgi:leader peptidase (prepilin peptidase) / N-methyltransferase
MPDSWILWGMTAILGAAIGSFLTLVTYRLPRDETIGLTRSRCPQCATVLRPRDLIPMLSWLFTRGRCRYCKTRVSVRYPLTELACALGTLIAAHQYGFTLEAFAVAGLWWCIVAIVVTDLEHYIILDEVQVAIVLFAALYHYALGTHIAQVITAGLVGLAVGLVLKYGFLYLRNKDGLGLGDVKLLFGAGLWLASSIALVPFLFYAGLLGVVFGLAWRRVTGARIFPFGPSLALALWGCVVWPQAMMQFWKLYGFLGHA